MSPQPKRSRSESMDPDEDSEGDSSGAEAAPGPAAAAAAAAALQQLEARPKQKRGRKKAPGNTLERRTQQNRLAQRNFRERRVHYVKELEEKLDEYKALLGAANPNEEAKALRSRITELEHENQLLRKINTPFDFGKKPEEAPVCQQCSIEQAKTAECMKLNKDLEVKVTQLELECTTLQASVQSLAVVTMAPDSRPVSLSPQRPTFPHLATVTPSIPQQQQQQQYFLQGGGSVSPLQKHNKLLHRIMSHPNLRRTPPFSDSLSPSPPSSSSANPESVGRETSTSGSDDWVDVDVSDKIVPSADLYGPLKVEAYRYALKAVPTLSNCKHVDELVDLVVTLTKCSNRKALRRDMVRSIALKHQILDLVNILERAQVIEIIEEFKVKLGLQHFNHFYQNMSNSKSNAEVQRKVLNQLKTFKQLAIAIPSLTNSEDLIDQLCLEFANQSLYTNKAEKEEKYIDFLGVSGQLQLLCQTEEDRKKLMLAMEVARESNRRWADEFAPFVNKDPVKIK
ncbi:hypothetical protein BDR26DRAFT_852463 [Obelidium mucronatum]|nr:hypothetical protein BDR26DRAFT_852463 [Obelidium mucronatum]